MYLEFLELLSGGGVGLLQTLVLHLQGDELPIAVQPTVLHLSRGREGGGGGEGRREGRGGRGEGRWKEEEKESWAVCTIYNKFLWMGSHPISLGIGLVLSVFGSSYGLIQIQRRLVQYPVILDSYPSIVTSRPSICSVLPRSIHPRGQYT